MLIHTKKKLKLFIISFISFIIYIFTTDKRNLIHIDNNYLIKNNSNSESNSISIALCTMAKLENLYINEFIDYYLKLGIDHIFIFDNNSPNTEKINDVVKECYKDKISIYETFKYKLSHQSEAFTYCYQKFEKKFDWFIMVDLDEYVYIVKDSLKNYLNNPIFNKCHFIKLNWLIPTDNNLLHYDTRPLIERFKGPYIQENFIKSIIRGNISNLRYGVHSPSFSPEKNITCNNEGTIIYEKLDLASIQSINIKKAYIIHFRYKSTEEFIQKYKRGYSNWHGNNTKKALNYLLKLYLSQNKVTIEKLNYLEKELNLNLSFYKNHLKNKK